MKYIFNKVSVTCLLLLLASCSISRKVTKQYQGKSIKEIEAIYGKPVRRYLNGDSCWVYVFDQVKRIKSQSIAGGNFHATQMSIPSAIRTDHYKVVFDKDEKVKKVEIESDYN
ncbi:outer membrane protein assembly factor BamE [Prolixibacteraceae bacterium]|nr:outer membrane protein assembly factor BamE [Prolixibacteraceae bacterium]